MSKIYIVEDDKSIREELAELLRNSGYEAEYLTDFSNSKADILSAHPDLILMDINIPNLNGEQLLKEIRNESDIPIIMVTSRTSETDEVLSMSYGADDYITKPYNPTILLLRISAVLKRSAGSSSVQTYNGLQVNDAKGSLTDGNHELILTKNENLSSQIKYIIDFSEKSFLLVYAICCLAYLKFSISVRSFKKILLAILALVFCGLMIFESSLESILIATLFTVSGIFVMPFISKKIIDD